MTTDRPTDQSSGAAGGEHDTVAGTRLDPTAMAALDGMASEAAPGSGLASAFPQDGSGEATVLIGRYTPAEGTDGVQRFRVGTLEGAVTVTRDATLDLLSPSWLTRTGGLVFAVCEAPESRVAALREDADGLTLISSVPSGGSDACHIAASPDGRWLALAHYTSGSVRLVEVPDDGQLEGALRDLVQFEGHGPTDRQDAPHAHQITWLDDTHFFCNDLGCDLVRVLEVDDEGHLTELEPVRLPAGFGPRHLVLRGDQFALVGELSGDLVSFAREARDGEGVTDGRSASGWRQVALVRATGRAEQNQPSGIQLFGDDLVVGNRMIDTLARFTWDADGSLQLVAEDSCGGALPRDVVVRDDEVWVALQEGNAVVVHRVQDDGFTELTRFPVAGAARVLF